MSYTPKILAFAGSLRTDSFNKKLVKIAAEGARKANAEVTYIDLRDYPFSLYDGDIETNEGIPEVVTKVKEIMFAHDGLLISSPEYNSGIGGVLKNFIDWTSRAAAGEKAGACYSGRIVSLMAASPGGLGGLRGLVHVKMILGNMGTIILPDQLALSKAHEAFNEDGSLKDEKMQTRVESLGANVADMLKKMHG
jgi:chromate reductase, NAD(P)H dehydrogenase (quinone)